MKNSLLKLSYVIKGDPVPLARARHGLNRNIYDPQKTIKYVFSSIVKEQHGRQRLFNGPIHLDAVFYVAIPSGLPAKKKEERRGKLHIFKPDLSNLLKFLEDAICSVVYKDDCIIATTNMKKLYDDGNGPRIEFTLMEIYEEESKK